MCCGCKNWLRTALPEWAGLGEDGQSRPRHAVNKRPADEGMSREIAMTARQYKTSQIRPDSQQLLPNRKQGGTDDASARHCERHLTDRKGYPTGSNADTRPSEEAGVPCNASMKTVRLTKNGNSYAVSVTISQQNNPMPVNTRGKHDNGPIRKRYGGAFHDATGTSCEAR